MKYQLAAMAPQNPQRFRAHFGADRTPLRELWDALAHQLPPSERIASAELEIRSTDAANLAALTIIFPPATESNEAHLLTVVGRDATCRVFVLEAGTRPDGSTCTYVAELRPDGRANWGFGPSPDLAEFVELVAAIVRDAAGQPLSFTPLKLA